MSWSVSKIVVDGDTTALAEQIAANNENYVGGANDSMKIQQEFALNVAQAAFDAGAVDGAYNISLSGHSNPDYDNDRKSLAIHFSPTTAPVPESEVVN